jgi:lipopolysaccharide transport system permease protein
MGNTQEKQNDSYWTEVIEPKNKWYDINLKELWDYRDLIMIFAKRDITSLYKQTILGPVWFFLGPIFTVIIYTFVFGKIAQISTEGVPGPLFYLAGTTLWNYFNNCFSSASNTFTANAGIFGKVYFPRLVSPISVIISNLVKFGIQMLMFSGFWIYYFSKGMVSPTKALFLLPILVFLMAGISLGFGIIISSLTTKYRDLKMFVGIFTTLLMYASPIIYPASSVPAMYKPFIAWNPIAPIIEAFRYGFTGSGTLNFNGLAYSTGFMIVSLAIGILIFKRVEKTFMDTV